MGWCAFHPGCYTLDSRNREDRLMMGSTRETVDAGTATCDDEVGAPDALENGGECTARVTVILIDHGTVIVDAIDWF